MATTGLGHGDRVQPPEAISYDIASWLLMAAALFLVLHLHLLPALFAGLSVYELVQLLAQVLKIVRIHHERGKIAAVGIVAFGVVLLLATAGAGLVTFVQADNLSALLNKMADSIESWRGALPDFIAEELPGDVAELRQTAVAWLRPHAGELKQIGAEAGRTIAHIFLGLGIGVLVSLYNAKPHEPPGPLARALQARASRVGEAFRRVVFAPGADFDRQHGPDRAVPVRRAAIGGSTSSASQNHARHHLPRRAPPRSRKSHLQFDHRDLESQRLVVGGDRFAGIFGCHS